LPREHFWRSNHEKESAESRKKSGKGLRYSYRQSIQEKRQKACDE
jgi:hypothetical protein